MVVAAVAVTVFTALSNRFVRERLVTVFASFFIAGYMAFAVLLPSSFAAETLKQGGLDGTVWAFYLFGDLFSTLMVASFFAFLNDSVTSEAAKRLYGLVGFGGVLGGAVGSTTVRGLIKSLSPSAWMIVLTVIAVMIIALALFVGRQLARDGATSEIEEAPSPPPPAPDEKREGGNPAFEGFRLVLRSRYLLSIVAIVGLYELVSTIMDFQFSATIEHYLDGEAIGAQFTTVYAITNWTAMLVQLFLTSFVMKRLGVGVALLVLPVAALLGSTAFLALPILWVGSLLNTADNAFSYSINQSAKEALYVPTTREEKYKAKAFIDMFVQRFAKALAVGLSLGMTL
ncbi:MAG: Npt1/Npt2 family nucleotide transporter, partial [Myxococcota bacterium]